jgi:hypothetical protein
LIRLKLNSKLKRQFMLQFMLIFHGGLTDTHPDGPDAMQSQMGKWLAWVEKLQKSGQYVSGEPLLPGGKLVTGPDVVTDGPYTEGKDVVGGYFIVNARDYDDAIAITRDYPDFELGGTVQIREVMRVDM